MKPIIKVSETHTLWLHFWDPSACRRIAAVAGAHKCRWTGGQADSSWVQKTGPPGPVLANGP